MRKILCFVLLSVSLFLARAVAAQDAAKADAAANPIVSPQPIRLVRIANAPRRNCNRPAGHCTARVSIAA